FLQQVDMEEVKILETLSKFKAEAIKVKHIPHLSNAQFLNYSINKE
ncbi:11408_t:CDS:1, partial [Dentiscutata erythropus]